MLKIAITIYWALSKWYGKDSASIISLNPPYSLWIKHNYIYLPHISPPFKSSAKLQDSIIEAIFSKQNKTKQAGFSAHAPTQLFNKWISVVLYTSNNVSFSTYVCVLYLTFI